MQDAARNLAQKKAKRKGSSEEEPSYPKIQFLHYKLSLASDRAKYPGSVYVNALDDGWYARIKTNGEIEYNTRLLKPANLETELKEFAKNPAEFAAKYGRVTSNCCFCNRPLTDGDSLAVGYGPVCADTYSLPWGNKNNPK